MPYRDTSKEELLRFVAGAFGCRVPVDREVSLSAASHLLMLQAEDLPECLGKSLCGFLEWGVTDIPSVLALDALIDFLDVEQWDLLSDPETFSAEAIEEIRHESASRERDLRGLTAQQVSAIVEWLKYMKVEGIPPGSMATCESALRYWSLR